MFGIYDRFGYSPQRSIRVDVSHTLSASVSDAELDALLDAGDTATLLALASGKPTPQDALPLPPDFTSGQAGGSGASFP